MQVTGLFHVAIKSGDLDATVAFYTEVLGLTLAPRPDFGFPGAWLALGDGVPVIHIFAGSQALVDGHVPFGGGAVDHVSLMVTGWEECLRRIQATGTDWRAHTVPGTNLWQMFVHDPSGVLLELTFDGDKETCAVPEIPDERRYVAGRPFVPTRRKPQPA